MAKTLSNYDLLTLLEEALTSAAAKVDLEDAMKYAIQRDPVRVLEALARLKALGLGEKAIEELGDSQLAKLAKAAMKAAGLK